MDNVVVANIEKQMVPCKNTVEVVSLHLNARAKTQKLELFYYHPRGNLL